ncbi:hypothetical protein, partial [Saccharopolyspora shandongensis]|uniref:hypothetical protein n=1 Tax=Saccharopolyspora shandongensis TaxID=418495 RepID=UPI0033DA5FF4
SMLSLLGSAVIGGVYYARTLRKLRQIAELDQKYTEAVAKQVAAGGEKAQAGWQEIIAAAKCSGVKIEKVFSLTEAEGYRLAGTFTDPRYGYANLASDLGAIEQVADQMTPYPIRNGCINLYRPPGATASQWEMTIPTVNILGGKIPHPIDHGPRSIEDPIEIATAADGRRISVLHSEVAHGMFSGMTDFGKSNLLNVHMFEWTRCVDAAVCLIAGETKAARTIKPLLAAYLKGEIPNPPIDRIAPTWQEAMRLLWDIKCGIKRRSKGKGIDDVSGKWTVGPDSPRIIVAIEEAGELLQSPKRWTAPDKTKWTFSDLYVEVITKARSEACNLLMLTQGGTMDLAGDRGSSIKKQILYRVAFRAQSQVERDAVLATNTRHVELGELGKGEVFLEVSADATTPTLALVDYMDDTAHGNIMDLAARMHHQYARGLDEYTASAMPFYKDRWSRPDIQQFLSDLMGVDYNGPTEPSDPEQDEPSSHQGDDGPASAEHAEHADHEREVDELLAAAAAELEQHNAAAEVEQLERAFQKSRTLAELEPETLRLLRVLQDAPAAEVPSDDLAVAAAEVLGLQARTENGSVNTEASRKLAAAIRDVMGSEDQAAQVKRRATVDGRKLTVWDMAQVQAQIRTLGGK